MVWVIQPIESRNALIERTEKKEVARMTRNASASKPTFARLRNWLA